MNTTTTGDGIEHGTYKGYQRCVRRDAGSCAECRAAASAYSREYRSRPQVRAAELAREAARQRAYSRLARAHPADYRALYLAEIHDAEVSS